jgi:hypothetical protein
MDRTFVLRNVSIDEYANTAEYIVHGSAERRHACHSGYCNHAGSQGVFHEILPVGVAPHLEFENPIR